MADTTESSEPDREPDNESEVFQISRGSFLSREEEIPGCKLRLLHIRILLLNYIIFKLVGGAA